ncbi:MAG: prepilin-type N-terminal cleavage/methylation domain-containing protein, partial [Planctomycetaceae bacterium]|nr:prepilin-type N-terminal cleavage/methylation domain-containing protein [Planctomycetaceae bacterium]
MQNHFHPHRRVQRSGFTLLELLIVLAIIVAIAAMVAPNLLSRRREANEDITRTTIKNVEDALKQKSAHNDGEYPTGGEEVI